MKKFSALWVILIVVFCPGCSGLHSGSGKSSLFLENTDWRLVEIRGKEILAMPGKMVPYLRLISDEGRVVGHGGCNRFFGGYKAEGDHLRFSALGSTKMACPGDTGDLEAALFNALGSVERFKLSGEVLELFGDRELLARFRSVNGM